MARVKMQGQPLVTPGGVSWVCEGDVMGTLYGTSRRHREPFWGPPLTAFNVDVTLITDDLADEVHLRLSKVRLDRDEVTISFATSAPVFTRYPWMDACWYLIVHGHKVAAEPIARIKQFEFGYSGRSGQTSGEVRLLLNRPHAETLRTLLERIAREGREREVVGEVEYVYVDDAAGLSGRVDVFLRTDSGLMRVPIEGSVWRKAMDKGEGLFAGVRVIFTYEVDTGTTPTMLRWRPYLGGDR